MYQEVSERNVTAAGQEGLVAEHYDKVRAIFEVLNGKREADLLLKNLNILDVHSESVYQGSILVYDQRIIALNPNETEIKVRQVFDGQGLYAIPGLIDAHVHFDAQLAHPAAFAEAIVPCGTTTIFSECLDFVSAAGPEAIPATEQLFKNHERLPYRVYAFAPGKKTSVEVTDALLKMEPVIGLGELAHLTYSVGNDDDFRKSALGRAKGGFMNTHWGVTTLSEMMLNYMPAIGAFANHDVWKEDDIEKSVRYGLQTQIKFGVGSPEVIKIMLRAIVKRRWPAENFQLCADNISVDRLLTKGHMDWIVSLCAEMGIDPIKAIKMATLYTARAFRMDNKIGSLTPGRFADIVLTDSLSKINPRFVFKDGELVAQDRKMLKQSDLDYSGMAKKPVPGLVDLTPQQLDLTPLEISADGKQAKVYLFDVYGRGHEKFFQEVWVPYQDGKVVPEINGVRYNRITVVQRYAKDKRHVVNGLFKGVFVDRGAVATFWPAPKAYFVAVGQDSADMCYSLKQVDAYAGGCVVTENQRVKAVLPLEIYGVMANMNLTDLITATRSIDAALEELGNRNEGEPVVNKLLTLFISLDRFGFMA
ncbi:adenine deaminase [Herbaspirillum sp. Sphag1AN]|uniref:adenine deaminase C-terminal domain-containing protein n=1 Tax=unclassified Herbaspirillum TaxID=2624150 RepID=UPI001610D0F1|nr:MULTISPECIES: adenine deaminase C-terminal domain-containing protein [unclassified Herbaspirillum]MBB3211640.1 adenine deaminase [Herbaspirillum sp. Sphag1AN]MBB3245092.1 adenine deaminase [Herbaspirillum sp. Sphag64]